MAWTDIFDVIAPSWTNLYRQGELQKLQMGREAGQMAQSPYVRAWIENNPDSALAHSVAHVMGLPSAFSGPGTVHDTPAGQPSPAPTDMRSSAWETPGAPPYEPPPPPPPAAPPRQTRPAPGRRPGANRPGPGHRPRPGPAPRCPAPGRPCRPCSLPLPPTS